MGKVQDREWAQKQLGLSREPRVAELKARYKKLVLENHPDRGGSTERLKAINTAYSILKVPPSQQSETPKDKQPEKPKVKPTEYYTVEVTGRDLKKGRIIKVYLNRKDYRFRLPPKSKEGAYVIIDTGDFKAHITAEKKKNILLDFVMLTLKDSRLEIALLMFLIYCFFLAR
jgi:hypothetical protein